MCLGKVEEQYNRAKVMAIECNPDCGNMVSVFFVDLGQFSVLPMNDLLAIPEYLIKKEPFQVSDCIAKDFLFNNCAVRFQAVLCSLVGIRPTNNDTDWNLDLCDRMYDEILDVKYMSIRPVQGLSGPKSDLDIYTYDCVLFDEDDQSITLNDRLVKSGLADYNVTDCHHLTDVHSKILDSDDSDTPENWDNDNYQRPQRSDDASESRLSDEDGVRTFEYNFTDNEVHEVFRSLVSHHISTPISFNG